MTAAAVFVSFLAFENFSLRNKLSIAVLGKNMGAAVISMNDRTDVIDLSGENSNSEYVKKYLEDSNKNSINNVFIYKRAGTSMSVYNSSLSGFDVEHFYLPAENTVREDMKLCGCTAEYTDYQNVSIDYGDYSITIENGFVYITYGDYKGAWTYSKNAQSDISTNSVLICESNGTVRIEKL
jgi:hypothetical protein